MKDSFQREINYLRLSVTELCNLRCRYCMGEEGVCKKPHEAMLTEEETLLAVKAAASLGIKKVRLTGGEPLVKRNILSIAEGIHNTDGIEELCITTNATRMPELAKPLRKAGVSRVNISIDTLDKDKYAYITRLGTLDEALRGIEATLEAGFEKVKLNAVLIGGFNDDEIPALAALTKKWDVDMRFIELMPMVSNPDFGPGAFISGEAVLAALPELEKVSEHEGVARLYRLPDAKGNVGIISPISSHFCAECNRLRLTADGKIKPCLHSAEEYSIKGEDYEGMRAIFEKAIINKPQWHGELGFGSPTRAARKMNQIGG